MIDSDYNTIEFIFAYALYYIIFSEERKIVMAETIAKQQGRELSDETKKKSARVKADFEYIKKIAKTQFEYTQIREVRDYLEQLYRFLIEYRRDNTVEYLILLKMVIDNVNRELDMQHIST